MNIQRLISKLKRRSRSSKQLILAAAIVLLTIITVFTFLTLFHTPRAPKLKHGIGDNLYQASNGTYFSTIGTKSGEPKITFGVQDSQLGFVLSGAASSTPQKSGNTLTFPDVLPHTDLHYTTTINGLKEELTIKQYDKNQSHTYLFDLLLNNISPTQLTTGFIDPNFKDHNGNYRFHFEEPFAIDANGVRTNDVLLQIGEDQQLPGKYYLKLIVDEDWLSSHDRAYPVIVDPTIVHDTTAEFAAGTLNRLKDTGSGSSPTLETYYQELSADEYTMGLWHLDELSGNSLDSSGNGNTGTVTGATVNTTTQKIGAAARTFNGTNQYISIPSTAGSSLDIDSNPITIEAWFNTNSVSTAQSIVGRGTVGTAGYGIRVNTTGKINLGSHGGSNFDGLTTLVAGKWYHVVGIINGADSRIYLNGNLDQTGTVNVIASTANDVYIGAAWTGAVSTFFNGSIDEVRISRGARTAEEIKSAASRRPSAVYTSEVLDLGGANSFVTTWNNFSWTELGVTTGDGETIYDNTGLVAQWNFNETSGTTADNAAGSCGASCDGTLTSFASTASQDQAVGTGWTTNNKRWGAGAIMLDGTDDNVSAGTVADLKFTGDFSLEAWVKPTSSTVGQIVSNGTNSDWLYILGGSTVSSPTCKIYQANSGSGYLQVDGNTPITDGKWHHVACTLSGTTLSLYIDGMLEATSSTTTGSRDISSAGTFTIGKFTNTTSSYYAGSIDSVRAYSRPLTATEIMSNYQAGQIELQTRVGDTTDPNDGTWEAWRPTTGESLLDSYDTTLSEDLIGYWPMDESSGTRFDRWSTNNLTANGTGGVGSATGKINGSADFESTESDFLEITDNSSLSTGDIDFTVSAWVNMESKPANQMQILSKQDDGTTGEYLLRWNNTNDRFQLLILNSSGTAVCTVTASTIGAPSTATWYHVVAWHDSIANTCNIKVNNGSTDSAAESGTASDTASNFRIGSRYATETNFFDGLIDEVGFWKRLLTAGELTYLYGSGSPKNNLLGTDPTNLSQFGGIRPSPETVVVQENSASTKYSTGRIEPDGSAVGLWHLDETGGTGAYLKDSTTNANHGTPTGTTLAEGVIGKGRDFNGSSDYIDMGDIAAVDTATTLSGCAWVYHDTMAADHQIMGKNNSATDGFQFFRDDTGSVSGRTDAYTIFIADSADAETTRVESATNAGISGKWNYVCFTYQANSATGLRLYINGAEDANSPATTSTIGAINAGTNTFRLGSTSAGIGFFDGKIDEANIMDRVLTAEEIAESYRLSRDHYVNKTISSTDLSGKTTLPFYVAADRPGSYLQASLGESAYAIGQPDSNTIGLLRLDEQSGSGAYIKDSSGNSNHGTPTGTTYSEGKVGKSRYFNNSSDYINLVGAASAFNISTYTASAWVYPTALGSVNHFILDSRDAASDGRIMHINTANSFNCQHNGVNATDTSTATIDKWTHIACISDGSSIKLYIDGVLKASSAVATSIAVTTNPKIGSQNFSTPAGFFAGNIDEFRLDNVARTPDEIRANYEYGLGLRSHPITIDFGANLDSGNLIADSNDLTFTVDATDYGLSEMGSQLFEGDKVIVRENYDGTEYIAQGTVTGVTQSTGAVTIDSWDTGSTFPSGGYTASASVFKWQREYWNISGEVQDSHLNAITNLSLRMTNGVEGRTIWIDDLKSNSDYLTNSAGSTITSSTGERYFQYRAILSSWDEAVSATLSGVTVDYDINVAPSTPTLDTPTDTATNQSLSPVLQTTTTDTDSDYLRYKIELCENLGMTTNCQTFDQTSSQTGWSGQNAQTNTAYTSGTQASYTLSSLLSPSSTYYWRSYAIDPAGTNTWSSTQGTPYSFTTTTAPTSPTTPWTEGSTNPTGIIDTTPEFSAIHNDGDGDPAVFYEIEVNTVSDFTGTVMWDTGSTAMTSLADGVRSSDVSYAGSALSWGTIYYWRIRFTDDLGALGAWSATQNFTTNDYADVPVVSSPLNNAIQVDLAPTITLSTTDPDSDYLRYRIQICDDVGMTTNCQTFDQTSSQTGWSGQDAETSTAYASGTTALYTLASDLIPSTTYYLHAGAIDPGGTNTWTSYSSVTSFTTRNLYESFHCLIEETINDSSLTITWTDRESIEDNYLLHRNVNGGGFSLYQTLAADSTSYIDSGIAQGNTYQYRIAPYTSAGPTTGEWCITPTLTVNSGNSSFEGLKLDGLIIN